MTKKPSEPRDPTDMSDPQYDSAKDPTSPFYEEDKAGDEPKPDPPEQDGYKVGPGHPPKQYTWRPGGPSPNPKGRPRDVPSLKPDMKKMFEDCLHERIEVTKDNKKAKLTRLELGVRQLVNQFAKGDRHARRDLFQYAALLGVDLQAKDIIAEALPVDHQAIVDAALWRYQHQQLSPEPASEDHVKAPPDLIDDDVTQLEPNEAPAAKPKSDTPAEKFNGQPLDEHGKPKPHDRASLRALQERKLAQQKKNQEQS